MLAMAVSAIVLVAMSGVFYSAVRLRERTAAGLDEAAPVEQALSMLRRDLQGAVGPGGVLAGDFKCGNISSGLAQSLGIEFFTTSGQIKDAAPWGDIQEVSYGLRDPLPPSRNRGKDLVRSITRNLLSQNVADAEDQLLLGNIQTLEVACYDGSQWRDSWDTSLSDTTLPSAVRVRIQLATENGADPRVQPYEIVVPLLCQTRTNQVANTGGLP
jgi:type II secretory pathway component PulJ